MSPPTLRDRLTQWLAGTPYRRTALIGATVAAMTVGYSQGPSLGPPWDGAYYAWPYAMLGRLLGAYPNPSILKVSQAELADPYFATQPDAPCRHGVERARSLGALFCNPEGYSGEKYAEMAALFEAAVWQDYWALAGRWTEATAMAIAAFLGVIAVTAALARLGRWIASGR